MSATRKTHWTQRTKDVSQARLEWHSGADDSHELKPPQCTTRLFGATCDRCETVGMRNMFIDVAEILAQVIRTFR